MKAVEVVLGGLLLASGLLGPATQPAGFSSDANLRGEATFHEANYTGHARLTSDDAGIRILGPAEASLASQDAIVRQYQYKENRATVSYPMVGGGVTAGAQNSTHVREDQYQNATIRVDGDPDGRFHVWPNESHSPGSLDLVVEPTTAHDRLFASKRGGELQVAYWEFEREFQSPLFGLADAASIQHEGGSPGLADSNFKALHVSGGVDLIVQNATIVVESEGDRDRYVAEESDTEDGPVPGASGTERAIVVVTLPDASLSLDLEGMGGVFLAREPTWILNGTSSFDAASGNLSTGEESEAIAGDRVFLAGNTTFRLAAEGGKERLDLLEPYGDYNKPDAVLPEPKVLATLDSNAHQATVDGKALPVSSGTSPVAEEVSWIGRILGILLLAWSVAKKLLPFAVSLLSGDPLANEKRRRIFEFVDEQGLAYTREIKRGLDFSTATAAYHLRILEEAGFLASVKHSGYRVFFVPCRDYSWEQMERLAYLASKTRREIARAVVEGSACTQKQLSRSLDIHKSTVSRHLRELEQAGLVDHEGDRDRRYSPAELLESWIQGSRDGAPS